MCLKYISVVEFDIKGKIYTLSAMVIGALRDPINQNSLIVLCAVYHNSTRWFKILV